MPSELYCPECKSTSVIEYETIIECPYCKLEFSKENLGEIEDENILSEGELGGIVDAFDELDTDSKRLSFAKTLEKED